MGDYRFPNFSQDQIDLLISSPSKNGYVILPFAFSDDFLHRLLIEATYLLPHFHPAGIGNKNEKTFQSTQRGDHMMWLDGLSPIQLEWFQFVEKLTDLCNQEFHLNICESEFMFTQYLPGASYEKHMDSFQRLDHRVLSVILYLNFSWKSDFGGQLRLFTTAQNFIDILPLAGTLVIFNSTEFYHEVLPATQTRFALTGWLKNRSN